jgi:hypothetical protein
MATDQPSRNQYDKRMENQSTHGSLTSTSNSYIQPMAIIGTDLLLSL